MTCWKTESGKNWDEKINAVNMIGAVSPAALPIERIALVTIPGTVWGRTTRLITRETNMMMRNASLSPEDGDLNSMAMHYYMLSRIVERIR